LAIPVPLSSTNRLDSTILTERREVNKGKGADQNGLVKFNSMATTFCRSENHSRWLQARQNPFKIDGVNSNGIYAGPAPRR
jgi:hypothetical protein